MTSLRRFLGAVGLLVVAIAGPLAVLSLVSNGADTLVVVGWTAFGLILWSQAIAPQAGLGYRVTLAWLLTLIGLILAFIVTVGIVTAGLAAVVGSREHYEVRLPVAIVTGLAIALAGSHPRRVVVLGALGRAAMTRATAEDSRLLAFGPGVLLRPGRTLGQDQPVGVGDPIADPATLSDRLAAADVTLAPGSSIVDADDRPG